MGKKIPSGYRYWGKGDIKKKDALALAKKLRKTGIRARVVLKFGRFHVIWKEK